MPSKKRGKLVNRSELAEILGVALTTVDSWTRKNDFPVEKSPKTGDTRWAFYVGDVVEWLVDCAVADVTDEGQDKKLNEMERRKLKAEVERLELKLEQEKGRLLDYREVESAGIDCFTATKTRLLAIPSKLAPQVVGLDPANAQLIIEKQIIEALEELSELVPDGIE